MSALTLLLVPVQTFDPAPPPGTEVPVLVDPTTVNGPTLSVVELSPLVASAISAVFIPMVVDFVAASSAPPRIKSLLAVLLAAVAGAVSTVVWSPGTSFQVYAINMAIAFVMAMAAHKAGVSDAIERASPGGLFAADAAPSGRHALGAVRDEEPAGPEDEGAEPAGRPDVGGAGG